MSKNHFKPSIWQIIGSSQKDEYYINKFATDLDKSIKQLFGVRFWIRWKDLISNCNRLLYYLVTSFNGSQTLGEEYYQVLQVSDNVVPSRFQRLTLSLLHTFQHFLLKKFVIFVNNFSEAYFKYKYPLDEVRSNVQYFVQLITSLNRAIFYFNATYLDLIKRLLSIRYLSTYQRSSCNVDHSTSTILGSLSLLHIILSLYSKYNLISRSSNYDQSITSTELSRSVDSKCLLCFSNRTDATLIECGHIFCWHCLTKWLQYKHFCPTCRRSVKSNRMVYLYNYN